MAVYRLVCALGHQSVVAVLKRCGLPLPAYFLADEKHSHCLTNRVHLPTIVNGMWIFHALVILCHELIPISQVARPNSYVTAPLQALRCASADDGRCDALAAVTACRHLSKIFVIVSWFGPFSSPPHHPSHTAHGLIQHSVCRGHRAGSSVGTEHA